MVLPNDDIKNKLKRANIISKFIVVLLTFLVLLVVIPLGFINPSIGGVSSFNFYRLTGGAGFYPQTGVDFVLLVLVALGASIYYVLYKKY